MDPDHRVITRADCICIHFVCVFDVSSFDISEDSQHDDHSR